jgi:hypothetical protein
MGWHELDGDTLSRPTGTYQRLARCRSCATPPYCMATGTGYPPLSPSSIGDLYGVAELWNGQSWSDTNFPGANSSASGVDCITTHWCMSILVPGQRVACGGQVSAALWNGSTWKLTPIPG